MIPVELKFRKPDFFEKKLLNRMLGADFTGKKEIMYQVENCQVRKIDFEGSLELKPNLECKPALVTKRIPVEAYGVDEDGIHIHVLLHVINGFIKELEIYKDDSSSIKCMPDPFDLEMIVFPI